MFLGRFLDSSLQLRYVCLIWLTCHFSLKAYSCLHLKAYVNYFNYQESIPRLKGLFTTKLGILPGFFRFALRGKIVTCVQTTLPLLASETCCPPV